MRDACAAVPKAVSVSMPKPYKELYRHTLDPALVGMADAFVALQVDRHHVNFYTKILSP
jgi:hypothetical protein